MTNTVPGDKTAKDQFWNVVRACLIDFHDFAETDADLRCSELRRKIEAPPPGLSNDIFYHAEPFDVACDLADQKLDLSKYYPRYERLLTQHG